MTIKENENRDNNSTSWQSGIRYIEEKNQSKLLKIGIIVFLSVLSSLVGGFIGSQSVLTKYSHIINSYNEAPRRNEQVVATSLKGNITKVAQAVGPSIVGISKKHTNWMMEASGGSLGSGIIFDERGYIVTNQHIVDGLKDITVILSGEKRVDATIVGEDYKSDIAVLKIDVDNLKAADFGNSDLMKAGETVIGMGNPLGEEFAGSLTVGVISATNKLIKVDYRSFRIYQTDMAFTKGNSGGAVINDAGNVIGIINNKLSTSEGGSFFMPINDAKPIIDALVKHGKLETPFLGVRTILIDEERAKSYKVPTGLGVVEVVEGTTAEKFGIQRGDIILSIDDSRISKTTDIKDLLEEKKPGDKIKVRVYRDEKEMDINTTLIKRRNT
ncbi:S1C family serine protease [Clostridium cylindrosporum]|uniref:Serine protease n=1 Tax=Clostridium cylindrosporum DSM 605 TaxID=1121307 RepID=A0A0J8D7P9_CLOCY|nr:trypsin-like peptidase domain-containing protein [Clostridium cylindrosporum]KMT22060.1 serine protease [Clostridium cylindrosporum DSM 605]